MKFKKILASIFHPMGWAKRDGQRFFTPPDTCRKDSIPLGLVSRIVGILEKDQGRAQSTLSIFNPIEKKAPNLAQKIVSRLGEFGSRVSRVSKHFPQSYNPEQFDATSDISEAKLKIGIHNFRQNANYVAIIKERIRASENESYIVAANLLLERYPKTEQVRFIEEELLELEDKLFRDFYYEIERTIISNLQHVTIGGMSHGSVSREAHSSLAQGANLMGTVSNSGEGGESVDRLDSNAVSAAKQVASGRFGVTNKYLISADEIQIKLAQAAKPGEGGELPGWKVIFEIAQNRNAKQGQTLISPPPNHDVYSIEDLYLLIHSLKCIKPGLKVGVKLVSDPEVPLVALGAVKAGATSVEIAGGEGGTGSAKYSSIFNTGFPWEVSLGLTHQLLEKAGVRDQVELSTSGGIKTGSDITKATAFGADSVAVGSAALVAVGCVMLRQCHKARNLQFSDVSKSLEKIQDFFVVNKISGPEEVADFTQDVIDELINQGYITKGGDITQAVPALGDESPLQLGESIGQLQNTGILQTAIKEALSQAKGGCFVGVNTQDQKYRREYNGTPSAIENMFLFQANSVARELQQFGLTHLEEIKGRVKEFYSVSDATGIQGISELMPQVLSEVNKHKVLLESPLKIPSDAELAILDQFAAWKAVHQEDSEAVFKATVALDEQCVSFGTALSSYCVHHKIINPIEITVNKGNIGPQNLGTWMGKNISIILQGSGNDHLGKGLSGGTIIQRRANETDDEPILGNQLLLGATSGSVFLGKAGTRFGVRLSGAEAVVHSVADHALEFMTNGKVVIKHKIGANFASGMTGGLAYVNVDENQNHPSLAKLRLISLAAHLQYQADFKRLLEADFAATGSSDTRNLLDNFQETIKHFKVIDPEAVDQLIIQDARLGVDVSTREYELVGDSDVGQVITRMHDAYTASEPNGFERIAGKHLAFSGKGGSGVFSHLPKGVSVSFNGRSGNSFGYALNGRVDVFNNTNETGASLGKYAFASAKESATVLMKGNMASHGLDGFAGQGVFEDMGLDSCQNMKKTARVLVLGEIKGGVFGFGQETHDDAQIVVNLNINPMFKAVYEHLQETLTESEFKAYFSLELPDWENEILAKQKKLPGANRYADLQLVQIKPALFRDYFSTENLEKGIQILKQKLPGSVPQPYKESRAAITQLRAQVLAGWDAGELSNLVYPMAQTGADEPSYSMGNQVIAVPADARDRDAVENKVDIVHFIQESFAQETRPPLSYKQEGDYFDTSVTFGVSKFDVVNFVNKGTLSKGVKLDSPLLGITELNTVLSKFSDSETFELSMVFASKKGKAGLLEALEKIKSDVKAQAKLGKRIIILNHNAQPGEGLIPSYLVAAAITGLNLNIDLAVKTNELLTPHLLDMLVNVGGAKAVCPVLLEEHLENKAFSYAFRARMDVSKTETWGNYQKAMVNSWKRIMAKDGMTNAANRVGAKQAATFLLDRELRDILGLKGSLSFFGLDHVAQRADIYLEESLTDVSFNSDLSRFQEGLGEHAWTGATSRALGDAVKAQAQMGDIEDVVKTKLSPLAQYAAFEAEVDTKAAGRTIKGALTARVREHSVAIIGNGFSALALAKELMDQDEDDKIKKIYLYGGPVPVPGGKVKYAVAPDHNGPREKLDAVIQTLMDSGKIEFIFGKKIEEGMLEGIVDRHSMVVMATGSKTRKWTGVGAEFVTPFSKMVAWYNNKPAKPQKPGENFNPAKHGRIQDGKLARVCPINLQAKHVVFNGMGNAVLDNLRILSQDVQKLEGVVAPHVLDALKTKALQEMTVIGRNPNLTLAKWDLHELEELRVVCDALNIQMRAFYSDVETIIAEDDPEKEKKQALLNFFVPLKQIEYKPVVAGEHVINFVFGASLSAVERTEDETLSCAIESKLEVSPIQAGHILAGDIITAIGGEQSTPIDGLKSDNGQAYFDTQTGRVAVPFIRVVGQADTGRGKVGDAESSAAFVAVEILQAIDQLPKYVPADKWIEDNFPSLFTKADLADFNAYMTRKPRPVAPTSITEMNELKRQFRLARNGVPDMSLPASLTPLAASKKVVHPVEVTFTTSAGKTVTKTFNKPNQLQLNLFRLMGGQNGRQFTKVMDIEDTVNGECSSGSCEKCFMYVHSGMFQDKAGKVYKPGDKFLTCQFSPEMVLESDGQYGISLAYTEPVLVAEAEDSHVDPPVNTSSACGVGLEWHPIASHKVVVNALDQMSRYLHRGSMVGGVGDGAGIMLDLDCDFFDAQTGLNFKAKKYGVCPVFLPHKNREPERYAKMKHLVEMHFSTLGFDVKILEDLTDDSVLDPNALSEASSVAQFILTPKTVLDDESLELLLNKAGMALDSQLFAIENGITQLSCSSESVVFKGRLRGDQMRWFKQLRSDQTPPYKSRLAADHIRFSTTTFSTDNKAHPFFNRVMLFHNGEMISAPMILSFLKTIKEEVEKEFEFTYSLEGLSDSSIVGLYFSVMDMIMSNRKYKMMHPEIGEKFDEDSQKRLFSLPALAHMMINNSQKNDPLLQFSRSYLPTLEGPANFAVIGRHNGKRVALFMKDQFGLRPGVIEQSKKQGEEGYVKWVSEMINSECGVPGKESTVTHSKEGILYIMDLEDGSIREYDPQTEDKALYDYLTERFVAAEEREFSVA